mmetsp:Transcript_55656/g.162727  ORF Transcript_55656/g.162727 Transcript_55656/m.162727 type:complete len:201 (+) Transcript_55656:940-1542(+)
MDSSRKSPADELQALLTVQEKLAEAIQTDLELPEARLLEAPPQRLRSSLHRRSWTPGWQAPRRRPPCRPAAPPPAVWLPSAPPGSCRAEVHRQEPVRRTPRTGRRTPPLPRVGCAGRARRSSLPWRRPAARRAAGGPAASPARGVCAAGPRRRASERPGRDRPSAPTSRPRGPRAAARKAALAGPVPTPQEPPAAPGARH